MKRTTLVALGTALAMLAPLNIAVAEPNPVTGIELNTTSDNFVGTAVRYNPGAARTVGLQALKELRTYMWNANPPLEGTPLRDLAAEHGITTLEEYLNVTIDKNLTDIAVQRAFEASARFEHKRPDGNDIQSVAPGEEYFYENLGAGRGLRSQIIDGWGKGELAALRAANGTPNMHNGHLVTLIHPANKSYGFGAVAASGNKWPTVAAAAARRTTPATPDTSVDAKQVVWMYRAPQPTEKPTGLRTGTPKFVEPGQFSGGEELSGGTGILSLIVAIVSLLGMLAGLVQFFLPRQ